MAVQFQKIIQTFKKRILTLPKQVWYITAATVMVTVYGLLFFTPKQVQFAYMEKTCVPHVTVAPGLQKQVGGNTFRIELEGGIRAFGAQLTSTQLCITPTQSPSEGQQSIRIAPFGGWIASKTVAIQVPEKPRAAIMRINGESISAARELEVPLTAKDALHTYSLEIDDKTAKCHSESEVMLDCDVPALQLAHGAEYTLKMYRAFHSDTPEAIGDLKVKTLTAVQLTDATVKEGQVVYDKPTEMKLVFDKPLKTTTVELVREEGDAKTPIKTESTTTGTELLLKLAEQLPRNAQYALTVKEVEAEDRSSLAAPITIRFTTSGGPKVTGTSIGTTLVGQNAQIIVTFDQAIKGDVDIAKFARLTGVNGVVRRLNDTQLSFTLQAAPLCAAFSLTVDKGLPSGSNDETTAEGWRFDSRTICGYVQQIGASVQRRPILAYYFGNGANTILFTGGIHGSEASGHTTMQAWIAYLQANPVPADKRIVVVPNANPDGIASGARNNAHNVNIDRNFPSANWSASIDTATGILPQGGGTSAGSEPEAQALITLTRQLRPRLSISFHAQGRLVGANKVGDSVAIGNLYASTVGYSTMFDNAEAVMGYSITGEYEDWMGEELGTPAILIELPTNSGNYLNSQMGALRKMLAV